jgi:ParB-like chromosome segregation protein Spo0J
MKAGIIAGHGRLLAARKLQLTEVPVIVLDHLTDAQKRAYVITDNQLALNAGWDEALLAAELAALQQEDFNLGLIGFDDEELARLLAGQDAGAGHTDEDAVPELPVTPISVLGDLWILGDHRLLVGDATDTNAVAKLLAFRSYTVKPGACSKSRHFEVIVMTCQKDRSFVSSKKIHPSSQLTG